MEDRKMSQTDFADLLSMSQPAYSGLERGITHIKLDEISHIAEVLDIPVHELLPETSFLNHPNSGNGSGITFGNCNFYIGTDVSVKAREEEKKSLEEKIRLLEKQIEIMEKGK